MEIEVDYEGGGLMSGSSAAIDKGASVLSVADVAAFLIGGP